MDARIGVVRERDRDEIFCRGVVDEHATAVLARLGRRQQPLELALAELPGEATRDEDGLAVVGHAERRELGEHGRERLLPRVDLRSRNRERRRFDDDGDAGPSPGEVGQGRTGEWKAKRIANGSRDVDGGRGRRRSEDDVLVVDRDVDDPRAREQRNTAHSWSQPSTCETSRRCRRINSIECRRR